MHVVPMTVGVPPLHALDGAVLTLSTGGGHQLSIDLGEAERDTETVISVFVARGRLSLARGGAYAAVIQVPPRRYTEEWGEDGPRMVAQPLNIDAVSLQLWALPDTL
ncbi:hypothetical protein GE253_05040 [Niveispirillum sp. SYP-B3756]|uniref:hypothetical protein n=1 Tax=Niveispirillum sp. SYP-B3756 TaxID=2662178 RepID=UPI001290DDED|nr:hypothetical protein [Niveispirillum sp. SYP-B3756]MQP64709.1 hypothetical protein [Niveispirillum sp. SYP-B3756]